MNTETEMRIEQALIQPVWVIDMLPERVSEDSRGQYFAIEEYCFQSEICKDIYERFFRILLKLNCYYAVEIVSGEQISRNPSPYDLKETVLSCASNRNVRINFFVDGYSMIVLDGDSLHLDVYAPAEELNDLLSQLAQSEGMFYWKANDGKKETDHLRKR